MYSVAKWAKLSSPQPQPVRGRWAIRVRTFCQRTTRLSVVTAAGCRRWSMPVPEATAWPASPPLARYGSSQCRAAYSGMAASRSAGVGSRKSVEPECRGARRRSRHAMAAVPMAISSNCRKPVRDPEATRAATRSPPAGTNSRRMRGDRNVACHHSAATSVRLINVANWLGWRRLPQPRPEVGDEVNAPRNSVRP
ncbi:hypothetical protein D3C72_1652610 [compost metagenome]